MYTSLPMFEGWGWTGTDWVKGFEIGLDTEKQLYVFFVNDNVRQRYYLKESELNYSKEKPE